jgi:basic membrane protein A and related proteins
MAAVELHPAWRDGRAMPIASRSKQKASRGSALRRVPISQENRTMDTTRRGFLGGATAGALMLSGLSSARAEGKTIGFIYVGSKDDYGWNQSHAVAAAALKGLPGITVVEEENVPETDAVSKTMESMINIDGASLLFPTSFGYFNPFMLAEARKYPNVEFRHPTGLWNKDKDPMNAGGYYSYMDQGHYVNGVAAGLSTKSNKIGYVAAKPIGLVLRNVNSFTVGVKKVNPAADVHLIITGEWSLPVREAESTQALIDTGCDVIACHVDSPKVVIETAEARGAKTLGHNADQSSLAPKGFVTGAEMKWSTVYDAYAKLIAKGEKLPNVNEGGYDKDLVKSTAFGNGASEAARKAVLAAIEDMKADKPIFVGGVKDNKGNVISAKTLDLYEGSLWGTNYLIEGVIGSIT